MRRQSLDTIVLWGATILLVLGHSSTTCSAQLAMSTAGSAATGVLEAPDLNGNFDALDFEQLAPSVANESLSAVYDFRGLTIKFAAFLGILLCTCIALIALKGRGPLSRGPKQKGRLRVDDSITLAAGVGLKLIEVGPQQMVVGYDRHGIKNMILIDRGFDEILDEAEHSSGGYRPAVDATGRCDVQVSAFMKPKDHGWDLNQRIF